VRLKIDQHLDAVALCEAFRQALAMLVPDRWLRRHIRCHRVCSRECTPNRSFGLMDGRVKPCHDERKVSYTRIGIST
jgi:hypothetical protein